MQFKTLVAAFLLASAVSARPLPNSLPGLESLGDLSEVTDTVTDTIYSATGNGNGNGANGSGST